MYPLVKRFFDIFFAVLAIIILIPVFIIIFPLLRFTGEGEIFYFQKRIGYRQESFMIWKFATMLKNSPNMGTGTLTLRNDPRVTSVGHYLRISKLNELPQIFNVLLGDMSLVGPRPQVERDYMAYSESVRAIISQVKPGVTGIGSIIFRDEEKLISETQLPIREFYNNHIAPYKGALEVWYQKRQSFRTDFLLLLLTAWAIFRPHSKLAYRVFKDLPERPEFMQL